MRISNQITALVSKRSIQLKQAVLILAK